jgi:hypothetical protein
MHGGPPQTETFDPKMDAPAGVRSVVGETRTSIPGVTFGSTFPKLAKLAHRTAVVRSFMTGSGAHDVKPLVGDASYGANLGSLYARVAGANRSGTGMPTNVALFPSAVDVDAQKEIAVVGAEKFTATGPVGRAFAPFVVGGDGSAQADMRLNIPPGRLGDRRLLLSRLDDLKRRIDARGNVGDLDRLQRQAFDVILGGVGDAFDLSREDPRTVARYDTGSLFDVTKIDRRWNNHRMYRDHAVSLGKLMLLARRLCERGCGFVTVSTNFVWDFHADQNNATVQEGLGYVGTPFDHAVSAFIEDIHERGLEDRILLVACGEMGRTPKVNKNGGRDHWGRLAPLLLSGGGLRMGQVIGASTPDAGEPASDPVDNRNLIATVMHTLLDVGKIRTDVGLPAEAAEAITGGRPIRGLH